MIDVSLTAPNVSPEDVRDGLCDGPSERIATLQDLVSQRRQLSSQLKLHVDSFSEDLLEDMVSRVQRMVLEFRDAIARQEEPFWVLEERHRLFAAAESMG
ncbi:pyridoxal-5'-phosphate-dependent protein beta subunit [Colletotrichum higginsianum IMI 349063]|uniref:Pyridoxal-5'-phosphate-dependent protein beta subunit n=1 Tax=Colletotrichum higginsianum (strain IMI 349063) TaxID=759273 RepID=A0A1B7YM01_COLHI|nr:pyridoxal-5'-phosphate-dependent protein beta subunit [Colletotrichum higginsianum IMI 349063]OBR13073.1 pyridoxal-5'-phosphate-dependent protein beta subunit [Colletotrichum higginsianum IMI 349063]